MNSNSCELNRNVIEVRTNISGRQHSKLETFQSKACYLRRGTHTLAYTDIQTNTNSPKHEAVQKKSAKRLQILMAMRTKTTHCLSAEKLPCVIKTHDLALERFYVWEPDSQNCVCFSSQTNVFKDWTQSKINLASVYQKRLTFYIYFWRIETRRLNEPTTFCRM